eukprot:75246-Chlamydomonas_euryale.AAC.3
MATTPSPVVDSIEGSPNWDATTRAQVEFIERSGQCTSNALICGSRDERMLSGGHVLGVEQQQQQQK